MPDQVKLSLATLCVGQLEEQFQKLYPAVIASLGDGEKGSLSITIEFSKLPDTSTIVGTSFKVKPNYPSKGKAAICQIDSDGRLSTDPVPEKPKLVNLFTGTN